MGTLFAVILTVFLGGSYFVPTVIAFCRGHQSVLGIFLLNFFLGWTLIGWLVALFWSMSGNTRRSQQHAQSVA